VAEDREQLQPARMLGEPPPENTIETARDQEAGESAIWRSMDLPGMDGDDDEVIG
jgi:hypothetical protein